MKHPQEWDRLVSRCLQQRLPPAKLEKFATLLTARTPISPSSLADILLRPRSPAVTGFDPLIPLYVERLLECNRLRLPDILLVLLQRSRYHHSSGVADVEREEDALATDARWHNSAELEETILLRVARILMLARAPQTRAEGWSLLKTAADWMTAVVASSTRDQMMRDMSGSTAPVLTPDDMAVTDALGTFVVALVENLRIVNLLSGPGPKAVRREFVNAIALYAPFVMDTAPQTAMRLNASHRRHGFMDERTTKGAADVPGLANTLRMQESEVLDGPVQYARAGLYVYLNALLVGRPMTDEKMIMHYLQSRHQSNVQSMATELITASFDALANATVRHEPKQALFVFRSFLVNKVPLLLVTMTNMMFAPLTAEYCITEALKDVDPQAFPSMFDVSGGDDMFSDVRQEFLFACCLHRLIPEELIGRLLDDPPMQELPSGGRYVQAELVRQCATEIERVERLIGEMENMDGNAGAVAGAICEVCVMIPALRSVSLTLSLQVIQTLAAARETLPLKSLCTSLARRPGALDVMLLFNRASTILQPICQLLDSWHYEEDQGEYQPVYEEFGSILLLVLVFTHRYAMTSYDLGLPDDSFTARYLDTHNMARSLSSLSASQATHLGGWIAALFDEGISDDLMSSCRPHDFYELIPTLFAQIVLATSSSVMTIDTIRGGLEYLLEASLVPCLVGGITWLTQQLWACTATELPILLSLLAALLAPRSISDEAETLHHTVLSLVSKPLEHTLRDLRRRSLLLASSPDLDLILSALQPHLHPARTPTAHHTELDNWIATAGGGLAASIRNTFQSLLLWSQNPSLTLTPASYTHRQLLTVVRLLGPRAVVHILIDELKSLSLQPTAALALDIATAIICAPSYVSDSPLPTDPMSVGPKAVHRLSLHAALLLHRERILTLPLDQSPRIDGLDTLHFETVVRLSRRVEAHLLPMNALVQGITVAVTTLGGGSSAAVGLSQMGADGGNIVTNPGSGSVTGLGMGIGMGSLGGELGLELGMEMGIGHDGAGAMKSEIGMGMGMGMVGVGAREMDELLDGGMEFRL